MDSERIAVLGATSLVGECLLGLGQIECKQIHAFSRTNLVSDNSQNITWHILGDGAVDLVSSLAHWVSLAPIWVLPDYFPLLQRLGIRKIVALSSTSLFTKENSSNSTDSVGAHKLREGEEKLKGWAEAQGVEWVIVRPTMIYGGGKDKNVSSIAGLVSKFGFFPVFGEAKGLRQPVHREDVAYACLAALGSQQAVNKAYNISGGEVVSYKEMVRRVFGALDKKPRFVPIPLSLFMLALSVLRVIPRFRYLTVGMVDRMNRDMLFDYTEATIDFDYNPRSFELTKADLPSYC